MTIFLDSLDELQSVFDDIAAEYEAMDFEPVLREQVDALLDEHQEHFEQESDSTGAPWPDLAESTIEAKGHDFKLFVTGALEDSLTERGAAGQILDFIKEALMQAVVFGSGIEYAGFHQEGTVRMPARPPVGVSDNYVENLTEAVGEFTVDSLKEDKQNAFRGF